MIASMDELPVYTNGVLGTLQRRIAFQGPRTDMAMVYSMHNLFLFASTFNSKG
jgi:hypothetical protein